MLFKVCAAISPGVAQLLLINVRKAVSVLCDIARQVKSLSKHFSYSLDVCGEQLIELVP